MFVASAAIMVLLALVGHLVGSLIGARIRGSMQTQGARRVDAVLGAVVGSLGVVVLAWLVLPSMSNISGWPAEEAHNSTLARAIDETLGRPPRILDGVSRSLGPNPFPRVFTNLGEDQTRIVAPPLSPVSSSVINAASSSVVKISGSVCGRIQSGSGFVVAPGLVVTNAHVVAGLRSVEIRANGLGRARGDVVAFDPNRDLAVVRTDLAVTPLVLGDAASGDVGVVLGYPGGGPLSVAAFQVGDRVDADGRDIYDRRSVTRRILVIGSNIAPGDSGGPLIDPTGKVSGVAFAIAPDRKGVAYAIRTEEVRRVLATVDSGRVSTGACLE